MTDRIESMQIGVDELRAANDRIRELEAGLEVATDLINMHVSDCAAERAVSDKLEKALAGVRATLWVANEIPNGPINDTIWHTKHETLFDFMDAALSEVAAIRAKGDNAEITGRTLSKNGADCA